MTMAEPMQYEIEFAGLLRATPEEVPVDQQCLAALEMSWDAGVDALTYNTTGRPFGLVRGALVALFDDQLSIAGSSPLSVGSPCEAPADEQHS